MATEAFYRDVENAAALLIKLRDHQRTFDTLVEDGDLTVAQRTVLEARANRHAVAARNIITGLDRDAIDPQGL